MQIRNGSVTFNDMNTKLGSGWLTSMINPSNGYPPHFIYEIKTYVYTSNIWDGEQNSSHSDH